MTGLSLFPELALFGMAAIALAGALWRVITRVARLEVNDTDRDHRLQALEDRVSILEVPEVVLRAEQRRLLTRAMPRKANGHGGHDTEGRA